MPFTRQRRTRRRRRRPMSRARAGPKALRLVRSLKPFIDKELHFADFTTGGTSLGITTTPTILLLTGIAEGVEAVNRTGSQATLRTLAYKLFWETGNTDACVRVTVLRDTESNGTLPTSVQLYENSATGPEMLVSAMNNDFTHRFRILQDYHVMLSGNWRPVLCIKKFRRLGTQMRFRGPSLMFTDVQSGGIWMFLTSNTAGGGANPTVHVASRIRFAP